ncbi:DUF1800 domain-containing protein, partial [bacterium]|nr:DUF1800 domain-containing protein [bacterium]
ETSGAIDNDGDGVSEIWALLYPNIVHDELDRDADGQSNFAESVAGTDPTNPSSRLELKVHLVSANTVTFEFQAIIGKIYSIQRWSQQSGEWEVLVSSPPATISENRQVIVPTIEPEGVYRVSASDVDQDADGLTAWEEALFGWSDNDPLSASEGGMSDFAFAIKSLEAPEGILLSDGRSIPQRLPTASEAARFLTQASFGPNAEEIEKVTSMGFSAWFEEQLSMPTTTTETSMNRTGQPLFDVNRWRHGWWRSALIAPDQLRQRMAYALSQIFVVNTEKGTVVGDNVNVQARYYDPLLTEGFGSFRDLLEHVSYSPAMGFSLSHLNNKKSDPVLGRFPDENFAREIMQLFTIGLWKLNPDGSRETADDGSFIPTYDNSVITEMAKVFTGMSHSRVNNGQIATNFYQGARGNDYQYPMKVWDAEHEPGAKILFDGVIVPEGQSGEEDVQQTLDALCAHPNVAPFVSRLLIQRFTSSNPSSEYLTRVSRAWEAGDGNLEHVVRAILFDSEVRTMSRGGGIRGKVREPIIRMTHFMRAFEESGELNKFGVLADQLNSDLGQFPMSSPTVFNFYLPDYLPPGELQSAGLFSPELQIATASSLLATHNLYTDTVNAGHWVRGVDYTQELILLEEDHDTLLDHLDRLMTYGAMSGETRAAARSMLEVPGTPNTKIRGALQMIINSPDFSILQ